MARLARVLLILLPLLIIPMSLASLIPNSTLPLVLPNSTSPLSVPTPTISCYDMIPRQRIEYSDCRQVLNLFKMYHPAEAYALTHRYSTQEVDINCPYYLAWGNCMLWLDFSGDDYPFIDTAFVDRWGNRLLRQCVKHNMGTGGKVKPLADHGDVKLKLLRWM